MSRPSGDAAAAPARPGAIAGAGAVVVAYRPDLARLEENLAIVRAECEIVLLDNSDDAGVAAGLAALARRVGARYLSMGGNRGIAAAQNAGFDVLLQGGKEYVVLLDDDSRPDPDLVRNLIAADTALRRAGEPVAAVSARARTQEGVDISTTQERRGATTATRDLMSSGSLIRAEILRRVGGMEERLFIDCVDFEWGWRAQARGLKLFLANDVYIEHALGMGHLSVMGLRVGIPTPIRHYYQYRNILWMLGRRYVPARWKAKQILSLAAKPLVLSVALAPRRGRLRYMLQGVRDALLGRGGRYGG